jgi:flagellar protein FliO/FliZ
MFKLLKIAAAIIVLFLLLPQQQNAKAEGSYASGGKSVSDWVGNEKEVKKGAESVSDKPDSGGTFLMIVKLLFMLGVVIALLIFVLRFIQKKSSGFQSGRALQLMGGVGLGPSRSVQAVKAGNSILLVGVGENVTLLKEITDEEIISQFESQQSTGKSSSASLLFNKEKNTEGGIPAFKELLKDQLNDLSEGRRKIKERLKEGNNDD